MAPYNVFISMVRDGYFYGIGCAAAAALIIWLAAWPYAIPLIFLGVFCLWFFRDPEREIPDLPGAIVSPGDGKVTEVAVINNAAGYSTNVAANSASNSADRARISIFLNVFNVHVNRSPIGGVIRDVCYQRGKFLNAMAAHSAEENEQNIITVEGEGRTVIFKQIAGLIARRIVCNVNIGDKVARGQRVGLIKFGSRVDVVFDSDASIKVKPGDHVKGGATVLAVLPLTVGREADRKAEPVSAGAEREVTQWKS